MKLSVPMQISARRMFKIKWFINYMYEILFTGSLVSPNMVKNIIARSNIAVRVQLLGFIPRCVHF